MNVRTLEELRKLMWVPHEGDPVIVPKGTLLYDYYPGLSGHRGSPRPLRKARKSYTVTVDQIRRQMERTTIIRPGFYGRSLQIKKVWVRWSASARTYLWADLEDLRRKPTPLEELAAVGRDWRE